MFNENRVLAIIPARGGSKEIPHKNIINLCGKPLISYTIEAAKQSKYIDYVLVSTDDIEIAEISRQYGAEVPFLRPVELASDKAKTIDVVLHAIQVLYKRGNHFDSLVLLQPTQPLRTGNDIDVAIDKYYKCQKQPLASVSEVEDHPILTRSIENESLIPLLKMSSTCRRQDMPKYYRVNGCIYINEINEITNDTSFNDNRIPYIMEVSHSVDIDEIKDLYMAEYYLKSRIK